MINVDALNDSKITRRQILVAAGLDPATHRGAPVQRGVPERALLVGVVLKILEVVPLHQALQPGEDLFVVEIVDCVYSALAVVYPALELAEALLSLVQERVHRQPALLGDHHLVQHQKPAKQADQGTEAKL